MSIFGFLEEVKNLQKQNAPADDSDSSSDDDSVKPVTAAAAEAKPTAEAKLQPKAEAKDASAASPKPAAAKAKKQKGKSQGADFKGDSKGSGAEPLTKSGGALAEDGSDDEAVVAATSINVVDKKAGTAGGKRGKKSKAADEQKSQPPSSAGGAKKAKKSKKGAANDLGDSRGSGAEPLKTLKESGGALESSGAVTEPEPKGKKRQRKATEPKAAPKAKKPAKEIVVAKMDVDDSDSDSDSDSDDDVVVAAAAASSKPVTVQPAVVDDDSSDDEDSDDSDSDSDSDSDEEEQPKPVAAVAAAVTPKDDSSDDEIINAPIAKIDRVQETPKFKKQLGKPGLQRKEAEVGATGSPRGSRQEIYCGGLPFSMTEAEIRELFESDCGPVTRINLLQRKGIAFITFASEEGAAKAVEYNETSYMGRTLKINLTSDRPPKPAGKPASFQQSSNDDYDENKPSKTVVVRNLSYYATEEAMKELFSECGQIVRCHIPKFEDTGKSTGKCFITYTSEQEAARAVEYNNTDIDGRTVTIRYVQPKPPGGNSNFRGGRGGGGRGSFRGRGGNRGSSRGGPGNFGRPKLFAPSGANANALGSNSSDNAPKSIVFEDSD